MAFEYSFNGNSRAILHALNQKTGADDPMLAAVSAFITDAINAFQDGTLLLVEASGNRASGGAANASPEAAWMNIRVTPIVLSAGTILVTKADAETKAAAAKAEADAKTAAARAKPAGA